MSCVWRAMILLDSSVEGARRDELHLRAHPIQHVGVSAGGHFLLVRGGDDGFVGDFREASPVFSAMGEQHRFIDPQLAGRANMAVTVDNHLLSRIPLCTLSFCSF
jgi:hypothetical protein